MPSDKQSQNIIIREAHTMEDLTATVALQKSVWQMQGDEATSSYVQNAVIHNGGSVLIAEHEGNIIGFTFGFPAIRGTKIWLWSHMAGVLAEYQGQGIGFMLKQRQRIWALDNGFSVIGWTFDPLQRGNANFNLNQLGAIAKKYYPDHYGVMTDELNAGLASDRLEVYWELKNPHVIALSDGINRRVNDVEINPQHCLVYLSEDLDVVYNMPNALAEMEYYVEIPKKISSLKQTHLSLAQEWQLAVRKAITYILAEGYVLSGFTNRGNRCWYVVTRS
jgi:predicted GNAT superfamily acetyltransferase